MEAKHSGHERAPLYDDVLAACSFTLLSTNQPPSHPFNNLFLSLVHLYVIIGLSMCNNSKIHGLQVSDLNFFNGSPWGF